MHVNAGTVSLMIKKPISKFLKGTFVERLLYSELAVYISYWVFQGLLYMDYRERIFKIFFDIVFCFIFYKSGIPLLFAALLAHTFNMFLNGHVIAMRRHMGHGSNDPKKFIAYCDELYSRINRQGFITGAAAYGSLSRNNFKPTSDIDIRVFPGDAPLDWVRVLFWLNVERLRALFHKFPLDIYAFNFMVIDKKMRTDEPPIIFYDPQAIITAKYDSTVDYICFSDRFKATHTR